jgi:hypothetical protein
VRKGLTKVAAYCDERGALFLRSAACPDLGCHVHWNSFEHCWDCPLPWLAVCPRWHGAEWTGLFSA